MGRKVQDGEKLSYGDSIAGLELGASCSHVGTHKTTTRANVIHQSHHILTMESFLPFSILCLVKNSTTQCHTNENICARAGGD